MNEYEKEAAETVKLLRTAPVHKSFQLLESVFTIRLGLLRVRVWRQEEVGEEIDNTDIIDNLTLKGMRDMALIADYIAQMDRVNAVEVTLDGNGIIVRRFL